MSTVNTNRTKYGVLAADGMVKLNLKCTHASFPINQGDLVFFDSGIVKVVTANADAATLAGIALEPSAVSSNLDNSGAPAEKSIAVGSLVVSAMKTTAAETYTDGTQVYVGADAATVTTVAPMSPHSVGVVKLPVNVASVTGATGVTVDVLIYSRAFVTLAL